MFAIVCVSCRGERPTSDPIAYALSSDSEKIQLVLKNLKSHEIQIMVTDSKGNDFSFQVNDQMYFYPASSVKFPVALLALEKAQEIPEIDSNTLFSVHGDSVKTTIRKEVQKIFAISDNEAYNRLFEFVGKDEINTRLHSKGLNLVRISHRLDSSNPYSAQNKVVTFFKNNRIIYQQESIQNSSVQPLALLNVTKGKGFYRNDSLIQHPMDFSRKNYVPITTLHEVMKRIQFPEKFSQEKIFNISQSDRQFLLKVMQETPQQQGFNNLEYYDSYVKFFLFGDTQEAIPSYLKIYNKVGYAYGYLTDCAYVVDDKNNSSFFITATIHVNENQLFNDDTYEYDEIGIPFLAELGRQVHQFYVSKNN